MSNQSNDQLIEIAVIGKTVGLKGELKLHLKTDFPEQFKPQKKFKTDSLELTIEYINLKRNLIKFKGFDTPETAKKLTNKKLFTTIQQTREDCCLKDGEYFWFDIKGCEVYENDKKLGIVTNIERILNNDYLNIKTDTTLVQNKYPKNFLIPFIKGVYIKKVMIEDKKIFVTGGFDLLEAS